MATFISESPQDTHRFGVRLGQVAKPGWVIGLDGDLGAGKTHCVKGIAKGLEIVERVTSPTFSLVNEYQGGRLPLAHLDFYRLETLESIVGAGLDEYFERSGITVVEWMVRWTGRLPNHFFRVRIEVLDGDKRRIEHDDFSA